MAYKIIPTYNSELKTWSYTSFESRKEFIDYLKLQFKNVGSYNLKNTEFWRKEAIKFETQGYYFNGVANSRDFKSYWDAEKEKILNHVIIDNQFIPGTYYFLLNFLPIVDKVKGRVAFAEVWDSDIHFYLYVTIAQECRKHTIVVKKRQAGYTYKHDAILIKDVWWGKATMNKIIAYDEEYIMGAWKFIEEYRDHLNKNTAFYRNFTPDSTLNWQQKVEVTEGNRKVFKGNKSALKGHSTKQSPTKGVGGLATNVYFEESGINPTLHKTLQYIKANAKMGGATTGFIMISGSVGELKDCDPLKEVFYNPERNGFLGVDNIWDQGATSQCGFFVPEYWNYITIDDNGDIIKAYDRDGNTDIEYAKQLCEKDRVVEQENKPETYRLFASQHPFSPEEAFAERGDNIFPTEIIGRWYDRMRVKKYSPILIDLERNIQGDVKHTFSKVRRPVRDFPVKKATEKVGCVEIFEMPIKDAPFGLYYAGVDPVRIGKTETSDSLASIYIYKSFHSLNDEFTGDQIVACYTGRYDDVYKWCEEALMLQEFYNARALVENNVTTYVEYLIKEKKQHMMFRKSEVPILQDLTQGSKVHSDYGVTMTPRLKEEIYEQIIMYCKEELSKEFDEKTGKVFKVHYGVERIKDIMVLEEMLKYTDKINCDRLISFGLALFASNSLSKRGVKISSIDSAENIASNNRKANEGFVRSPFKQIKIEQGGFNSSPFNKIKF
jgi:hypothetical protein